MRINKMNRIATLFQEHAQHGNSLFIPYITGGDPSLTVSEDVIVRLEESGADLVEYGVPFSDPAGDGPVIQKAALRALQQGVSLRSMLHSVERLRQRTQIPLLIFTYYNPLLVYGEKDFARDAANAGVDGVLCVDLPPDDADVYRQAITDNDLIAVFLAAPTSTDERLAKIGAACDTFVYYISRLGVTGERAAIAQNLAQAVTRVREKAQKPVVVGFGISTPDQARSVAGIAEGVVIGSAIVRIIDETPDTAEMLTKVGNFAKQLADAIKSGHNAVS